MPLPASTADRKLLHTRTVKCEGYERADGLWDVDGWMTDVKTYSFPNRDRGEVPVGEPLHGMGFRITYDDRMTIVDALAVTEFAPFRICGDITPKFKELIGMRMVPGFTRAVKEKFGGVNGCTHLVEMLGTIATTAFQTIASKRFERINAAKRKETTIRPPLLDTCHSWDTNGPIVQREFPQFYSGANKEETKANS
ncbi:MAG: DUF2889 domain-containing protein [Rhodospirillaceae bacterium]|nr:DUF2889 domain-containing protein [Rhodospirillaceae bacterium]